LYIINIVSVVDMRTCGVGTIQTPLTLGQHGGRPKTFFSIRFDDEN